VSVVASPTGVTSEGFALPEQIASLLPIVAFALIFWLLLVRPAQRRRKQVTAMQSALAVGDQVMLSSGVYGTVAELHDDRVSLEIADQVVITVARGAIGDVLAPASTELES
jgi:preprotein translocase subunit YajC